MSDQITFTDLIKDAKTIDVDYSDVMGQSYID